MANGKTQEFVRPNGRSGRYARISAAYRLEFRDQELNQGPARAVAILRSVFELEINATTGI